MNLKEKYSKEIAPLLMKEFLYKSIMQVPRIEKIVINAGVGDAAQDTKNIELAFKELYKITGQKPVMTKAKKSISTYKVREGQNIGVKVTLRNNTMWNFLEKLICIAIPRIRDFRGISNKSFDGRGNFTIGIKEQIIFPEIHYDDIKRLRGFDITIVTSSLNDKESYLLLKNIGIPFIKSKEVK
ncbi:MAG: 50S ribosomal protein L5 [Mycoplasmoidaceae bacterium]